MKKDSGKYLLVCIFAITNSFPLLIQTQRQAHGPHQVNIKKSLKIPKGQSESVYRRRTDNTMVKRKGTKGQTMIYKTYT
jgi:hypothetical protein